MAGRRVVPPAGEPRVETPLMIGTTSMELWCSQLVVRMMGLPSSLLRKVVPERCCTGRGYFRDPRLAIRQHHSPLSDGCKGGVFPLNHTNILFRWVLGGGGGLGGPPPPPNTTLSIAPTPVVSKRRHAVGVCPFVVWSNSAPQHNAAPPPPPPPPPRPTPPRRHGARPSTPQLRGVIEGVGLWCGL